MATYDFDWEGIRERALAMEAELPLDTKFDKPALRHIYREEDGKLVLDKTLRDDFVAQVTRAIDRDNLETENKRLKDDRDRAAVRDEVRRCMLQANFRPELLDAAAAQFMAEHKFTVRDGQVLVVGKAGIGDALSAAVQWADSGEVDVLLGKAADEEGGGEFMQAVNRMKSVH